MARRKSEEEPEWEKILRAELSALSQADLIERIIKSKRDAFSKVGKRNVATAKSHERRVKSLLTEWAGVEFRRRRVEGRGDDISVVEGVADVIPVKGETIFAIEAKKGEGFSLDAMLSNVATNVFCRWWHQTVYDSTILSKKTGRKKFGLLFFKPIPAWDWVAVESNAFHFLKHREKRESAPGAVMFPHLPYTEFEFHGPITHNVAHSTKNKVMVELNLPNCIICRWKDFAANVDPSSIWAIPPSAP